MDKMCCVRYQSFVPHSTKIWQQQMPRWSFVLILNGLQPCSFLSGISYVAFLVLFLPLEQQEDGIICSRKQCRQVGRIQNVLVSDIIFTTLWSQVFGGRRPYLQHVVVNITRKTGFHYKLVGGRANMTISHQLRDSNKDPHTHLSKMIESSSWNNTQSVFLIVTMQINVLLSLITSRTT